MNEPSKMRTFSINKDTLISFSVAIAIGTGMFIAGGYAEKLQRLDGVGVERRLAKIEVVTGLIAKRLGIPPEILATIEP